MAAAMLANGGAEIKQDVARAEELLEALAAQRDGFGLFGLGLLRLKGRGVPQDFLRAQKHFKDAAREHNVSAHYYLGVLHELGIGVAMTDRGEGVLPTYKPNHGYLDLLWITGASPDVHLQKAVLTENNAPLDFGLDMFDFAKAEGPIRDKHAFQFVTLLYNAGEGNAFARFLAGMRYEFSLVESYGHNMLMDTYKSQLKEGAADFVEPSYNRIAFDMYLSAADKEFVLAQRKLGLLLGLGTCGVERDHAKAIRIFQELSAKNDPIAQFNLGVMHLHGRGMERDDVKAAGLFQLAARQGLSDAEYNLGLMYEQGCGVKKDALRAKQLFTNASKRGLSDATEKLNCL
ncbi:hypothetical protein BDR26DRAFT_1013070 [Obelidium mucronatum]|nr:hypothetical protein BDR26DRAFT_1013070 [Obelidium mucronatum]